MSLKKRFRSRGHWHKHRTQYPNPPKPTKNGIFLCCRACHTSVCLHPSALKTSRFMIAFGLPFFWFDFSSGRGKSAEYTGVCASILTMSWRKSVQKNGFVCCALCLSIRESNPICPALVKLSPFRIVGLARRQPCCTLTHQKNEIFPACRVAEFPQSKFFVRQGKSADHPDGLTGILMQDCGKFACGNHIVFDSLMLNFCFARLNRY